MNSNAHANILIGAVEAQTDNIRKFLQADYELLRKAGNYPDYFDDPIKDENCKQKIDPEWTRFCVFPDTLAAPALHFWPGNIRDQTGRIPLLKYLLQQMLFCYKNNDICAFIKFTGCLSHYFGDLTQPAHLYPESDHNYIAKLLPIPDNSETLIDFDFHTTLESVTGVCSALSLPKLLGTDIAEVAWHLSRRCRTAIDYCVRFIVPLTQALFSGNNSLAVEVSSEPVTIAAQLTADAIYTIVAIAKEEYEEADVIKLSEVDLRTLPPDRQFHDSVYGGAIIDGNKDVPPNNVPVTAGKLKFSNGIVEAKGFGMLPHSGMAGPRESFMEWKLPLGVFHRFTAKVGLHAEIATSGTVAFHVLLDDKEVWCSGRMTNKDFARDIIVDIENAKKISLKVSDESNGTSFWKNHAFWMEPCLVKKG